MWSTLKRSSRAKLGHNKRDIPTFDTVLFHSKLSSLRRKFSSDVPTDKMVLSCGPKISKRPYWWLKNKERKFHFRMNRAACAKIKSNFRANARERDVWFFHVQLNDDNWQKTKIFHYFGT